MQALQLKTKDIRPELTTVEDAVLLKSEIRVSIKACGLNFADLLMIKSQYQEMPPLPFTMGMEPAGIITEIGTDVTGFSVGDRVAVFAGHGGLAQSGCFDAAKAVRIPDDMPFTDAAAFQIAYGTSHLALTHRAKLQAGETLLVLGAAGGVGLTAVEIGKLMGARVVAVARGADKLEIARQAGADVLLDSDTTDLRAALKEIGGVDVVYDAVGGEMGETALRSTNPEGRYVIIGFASGAIPEVRANHVLVKNINVQGFYWGGYMKFNPKALTDSLQELMSWYSAGKVKPHISHQFPLEQVHEAFDVMRARKSTGKIVVTI